MYYKLSLNKDGTLEIVDRVDEKKPDGFIYATLEEIKKIKPKLIHDYNLDVKDIEL